MSEWLKDWPNILSLIVSIISMFGFPNLIRRFGGLERLSKSQIEYRQAKELIHLITQAECQGRKPHAYLIEKGYGAISGTNKLDSEEIIYCLGMKSPNRALRYYTLGLKYLEYSAIVGKVYFKEKFNDRKRRLKIYILNYIRYFIFAIIAAVILWVPTQVDFKNSYYSFIFLAIISLPFIGLSFVYLSEASDLNFAEKFMKLQAETFKESEFETLIANEPETKEPEREN